ncbi:MAG: DUF4166 domain-containing protein [Bryobacteraceae bacterium]
MRYSARQADELKWVNVVLFLAAVYNVVWGAIAAAMPAEMLARVGLVNSGPVELWQCIGMFVALYGVGYWFASTDPARYWPFILIGLIGKVLGPIGALIAIASGRLPRAFLWVNLTNDFVWWIPFGWSLWVIRQWSLRSGTDTVPLYRRVIGADFNGLTPRIRSFHDSKQPVEVRGVFRVTRGKSVIGNWLTDLSRFPRSHEALPVSLRVEPVGSGERWLRRFGETVVESWQFEAHGFLVERFGPLVLYLQARVVDGALEVTDLRSTFIGVPLPPFLSPRVAARGIDGATGIEVEIRIWCAPLGLLVEYSGTAAFAILDLP